MAKIRQNQTFGIPKHQKPRKNDEKEDYKRTPKIDGNSTKKGPKGTPFWTPKCTHMETV